MQQLWRDMIVFCLSTTGIVYTSENWRGLSLGMVVLTFVWTFGKFYRFAKCINDQEKLIAQLRNSSNIDALTGLGNRNSFVMTAHEMEVRGKGVTVIVCDIDGLKWINDTLGHLEGDARIRRAAEILRTHCPNSASLFRMGGDEFLALIPNVMTVDERQMMRDRIRDACGQASCLSLSVGMACMDGGEARLREAIREADCRMYAERKGAGRGYNHVEVVLDGMDNEKMLEIFWGKN